MTHMRRFNIQPKKTPPAPNGSSDVIAYVTNRFATCNFLLIGPLKPRLNLERFPDIRPNTCYVVLCYELTNTRTHTHTHSRTNTTYHNASRWR